MATTRSRSQDRRLRWALFLLVCFVATVAFGGWGLLAALPAACLLLVSWQPMVPVAVYHSVHPDKDWMGARDLVVTPDIFEQQLQWLCRSGYRTIFLDELLSLRTNRTFPKKTLALTFDDGYFDTYCWVEPLLARYGFTGTVFVTPDLMEEGVARPHCLERDADTTHGGFMNRAEVAALAEGGVVQVQSHCLTHRPMAEVDSHEWRGELTKSRAVLEEITGEKVHHLCFPRDSLTPELREEARRAGYRSQTGGWQYNTGDTPDVVSRTSVISTGQPTLDLLLFRLELKLHNGSYWAWPFVIICHQLAKRHWRRTPRKRETP